MNLIQFEMGEIEFPVGELDMEKGHLICKDHKLVEYFFEGMYGGEYWLITLNK